MPTNPQTIVIHIDGGSRGNPGPAAFAVVVDDAAGARLDCFSKLLGETTNNVAEYEALLAALDYATRHKLSQVRVISDSELLVRQMQGRYKVKSGDLKPLFERAQGLARKIEGFSIAHVRREQNREADRLVNEALDSAESEPAKASREGSPAASAQPLRARAMYSQGALRFQSLLPLDEGEEVEVEIRRTNRARPTPTHPTGR
ncbi:MAG: ribonuclease HI family protein [Terriglobia bacterium]